MIRRQLMRSNLLFRLLGLSLAVAALSIGATAWLITQGTTERLRGAFTRTLHTESYVHQELSAYGLDHDSWDDVGALVRRLALEVGEPVALTTMDGTILADSADRSAANLPSVPTAEIDTVEMLNLLSTPTPSRGWRLTGSELVERTALAEEATTCLQAQDAPARVAIGDDGAILIFPTGPANQGDLVGSPSTALGVTPPQGDATPIVPTPVLDPAHAACIPQALFAPSAAQAELAAMWVDLARGCLDDAGISYEVVTDSAGLSEVVPAHTSDNSDLDCIRDAKVTARASFMPESALLYVGARDRFDPFAGDGLWRTLGTALAVLAAATVITTLAGRRVIQPIRALTAAAGRLQSGERDVRVAVNGGDELAVLGRAFNAMAESLAASDLQRRALVSDVAHELRTPLANVRGYLEAAEDGVVPLDPLLITSLLQESALLQRLVDDLQILALADAGQLRLQFETCDVAEVARQVAAIHAARIEEAGLRLVVNTPDPVPVEADAGRLRQALGNLLINAVQHTGEGGELGVSVRSTARGAVVEVTDTGAGIAPQHLPRLFDRFYRADPSRSRSTGGSGLGLAIAKQLVGAHGGKLTVSSVVGEGSTFTIRLPRRPPPG